LKSLSKIDATVIVAASRPELPSYGGRRLDKSTQGEYTKSNLALEKFKDFNG
jgi:hypothetical protein